ncbi:hypothetical protein [Cytobacillus gottheilii]|uniref:hypothetical protein n=1 Tax=Cytobacillus gottheilii TaxID=859144 RepID=UPI0009BA8493|nr:hypothetical protein [Cytobacillus gottheilii]
MNVGFSIPIHADSKKYIDETLGSYEEVKSIQTISNPIIHMYAKRDTLDLNTGELYGYTDALFSEHHVYDTKLSKVYKSKGLHDAIYFGYGAEVSNVKVFKDGSTLVHLRNGEYEMSFGTAVHVYKK